MRINSASPWMMNDKTIRTLCPLSTSQRPGRKDSQKRCRNEQSHEPPTPHALTNGAWEVVIHSKLARFTTAIGNCSLPIYCEFFGEPFLFQSPVLAGASKEARLAVNFSRPRGRHKKNNRPCEVLAPLPHRSYPQERLRKWQPSWRALASVARQYRYEIRGNLTIAAVQEAQIGQKCGVVLEKFRGTQS